MAYGLSQPAPPTLAEATLARAFPSFQSALNVAQEAAWEANKQLDDLRGRLGIRSDYGTASGNDPQIEPSGEVEAMHYALNRLTDTVRDLRGLAETLNSRL